jgi:hypothetical protein
MEPKDQPNTQPRIIFVNFDQNEKNDLDPETVRWLTEFVEQMSAESFVFGNISSSEPTELQELEYLDTLVQGDDHPDTLRMIMDAYNKHNKGNV